MNPNVTTIAFLVMSVFSLAWQFVVYIRLHAGKDRVGRALRRTSLSRVVAAAAYVVVGVDVLTVQYAISIVTFAVFFGVQVLWQLNAFADIRLRRYLDGRSRPHGKHRA